MNCFKKMYCRIYQGLFRLVLPILPYREPKVLSSCDNIKDVLNELKSSSVKSSALRDTDFTADVE